MQQEPDSWEIITEIDPLNVGEIIGSIGGFWGRFHGSQFGPTRTSMIVVLFFFKEIYLCQMELDTRYHRGSISFFFFFPE